MLRPVDGSPDFYLHLAPSRYLSIYFALLHVMAGIALWYLPLIAAWQIALSLLVLLHWGFRSRRIHGPVEGLECRAGQMLAYRGGDRQPVLVREATVWRWAIFMTLCTPERTGCHSVVILPDSAPPEQRRRLRVCLRHCLVEDD